MPVEFEHEAEPFWVLAQAYPGAGDLAPLEREVVAVLGVEVVIDSRQVTLRDVRLRPGPRTGRFDLDGAVLAG